MTRYLSLLLLLCSLAALAQTPLTTFTCYERVGRDWPRTLVTYPLQFQRGQAKAGMLKLVDAAGVEQPYQLWHVESYPDDSLKTARISFYAELKIGGSYAFSLLPEKPAKLATTPTATERAGLLTLDNGITALRLPAGEKTYKTPLAFCPDHATAVAHAGKLAQAGFAFGPIAGVRLADGSWVGGSYFAYEPIEAVRQREQIQNDVPADAWARAAKAAPRVTGYQTKVLEQGPLFTEARIRFTFTNGGSYQLTARILAGDPAIRLDEVTELKTNCPPDDPLYVVMSLSGRKAGWMPDAAFLQVVRRQESNPALDAALKSQGFTPKYASTVINYAADDAVISDVVPLDPWGPRAQYFGIVNTTQLTKSKTAPFLAVVPMHAGAWRAAHWVFPPKNPYLIQQLLSYKDGDVAMRWTIRAQPHPQNLLQTGEYDQAFGLTGMRRLWCLVGGPFQYHDTLFPLRAYQGFVNLDSYKDWVLEWSDDTRAARTVPVTSGDSNSYGPYRSIRVALMGGDADETWFSHFRQAEEMNWVIPLRTKLADPKLTPEERGHLRTSVAAYCSLLTDPDFNTRATMSHQGNPNMPINRFMALPFAGSVIPDHPQFGTWLDTTAEYLRYKLGMNETPGGAWSELITYFYASEPMLGNGALVLRENGRLDDATAQLAVQPVDFTTSLLSPPDPRFGYRIVTGFGHEGLLTNYGGAMGGGAHWLTEAALEQKSRPDKAAVDAWVWANAGKLGGNGSDTGFFELTKDLGALAAQAKPEGVKAALHSVWLPGVGATMRAHPTEPGETYLAFRQGYLTSHSDANQGDFVFYAKGVPLVPLSLVGYAIQQVPEYIQLNTEFGWHSRVRFGAQNNTGEWPGGGPISGIHRHFFSDSLDYLRSVGEYAPQRWTRQVLMLKGRGPSSTSYALFRDSFRLLPGQAGPLQPTWWYLRTLGKKEQVTPNAAGFEYTSAWGPHLQVHFLAPAQVQMASRDATTERLSLHNRPHLLGDKPQETITVNAAGPITAGQDVLVALYPTDANEPAPAYAALGDGAAKITTRESTDFVFVHPDGMTFKQGDIAFQGISGAVRIFPDEVHLIIAEGACTVSYKGYTLKADQPVTKVIPLAEIAGGGTAEEKAEPVTITFALDPTAGAITDVQPGVKKQALANGVAYLFDSAQPLHFAQDGVVFDGKRGGITVDTRAGATRLVMLDGTKIGYGDAVAEVADGPYDLTFYQDKVTGVAEGPARLLYVSIPDGLNTMPCITIDGIRYAPGSYTGAVDKTFTVNAQDAIIPLLDGHRTFSLENLPQPRIFRNWQLWNDPPPAWLLLPLPAQR